MGDPDTASSTLTAAAATSSSLIDGNLANQEKEILQNNSNPHEYTHAGNASPNEPTVLTGVTMATLQEANGMLQANLDKTLSYANEVWAEHELFIMRVSVSRLYNEQTHSLD